MRRPQRRRKVPVTTPADGAGSATSGNPRSTRALIRRFHVLLRRRAALASSGDPASLAQVEGEIESLGGLSAYQGMSTIGQGRDRGGGSQTRLIGWLRETMGSARKLRLLDVGALKPDNYRACSDWIDATPIDLRSRHPAIREQDFMLIDPVERWDVVSLSLVLNFVPEPRDRGRMLRRAHDVLGQSGLLFLVLPLACVENSRYLTEKHLEALMRAVGFIRLRAEWRRGGKMAYFLYQRTEHSEGKVELFEKKRVLRQGSRNNFCILL